MGEAVDIRKGINILCDPDTSPLFSEELDAFMSDLDREAALGKISTDPKDWEMRFEYLRDKLRAAVVARKAVAIIASDAATLMEQEPEKFAGLPAEQQAILGELASRVITSTEE